MLQPVTHDDGGVIEDVPDQGDDIVNVRGIQQVFFSDTAAKKKKYTYIEYLVN